MINIDAHNHVSGKSIYLDDIIEWKGTLYALPFDVPVAHAKLGQIHMSGALSMAGVIAIFTAKDIPGKNQIGGIIADEPLFAEGEIHFWGQPIGIIVATSERICRLARELSLIHISEPTRPY